MGDLTQEQEAHLNQAINNPHATPGDLLDAALTLPTPDTVTPPGPRKRSIEYWLRSNLTPAQRNLVYEIM